MGTDYSVLTNRLNEINELTIYSTQKLCQIHIRIVLILEPKTQSLGACRGVLGDALGAQVPLALGDAVRLGLPMGAILLACAVPVRAVA